MTININDYDKVSCTAKEAYEWMLEDNYVVQGCYLYRLRSLVLEFFNSNKQNWELSSMNPSQTLSANWFKLVSKPKPDRFAVIDAEAEHMVQALERDILKRIAREIVRIVEAGNGDSEEGK